MICKKPVCLCFLILLFSCSKNEYKPFVLQQNDICHYFYLKSDTATIDGKLRNLISPEINKERKDAAGKFFTHFSRRFDYLLVKEMNDLSYHNNPAGSHYKVQFCEKLQSNEFYNNILLLTPTDSITQYFTTDEMMRIASRFFYCDTVLKKGDKIGIGSHVCVGINGLSELKNEGKLIALEAFVFEAINTSLSEKKNSLLTNFYEYVNEVNKREKPSYTDDKTYLEKIRQQCYALMEQDKALKETLLGYYEQKKKTVGFELR